jgi:hypothetical protein
MAEINRNVMALLLQACAAAINNPDRWVGIEHNPAMTDIPTMSHQIGCLNDFMSLRLAMKSDGQRLSICCVSVDPDYESVAIVMT